MSCRQEPAKTFLRDDEGTAVLADQNQLYYNIFMSVLIAKDDGRGKPRPELWNGQSFQAVFFDWKTVLTEHLDNGFVDLHSMAQIESK